MSSRPGDLIAVLEGHPDVVALLEAKTAEARDAAEAIARTFARTGAYAGSLRAEGTRLLSTDPFAHLVEWGSVNNPVYAPLRRAAESVGARVVDGG